MYKKYILALITCLITAQQAAAHISYDKAMRAAKIGTCISVGAVAIAGLADIGMNTMLNPFAQDNRAFPKPGDANVTFTSKDGYLNKALYVATSPIYGIAQLSKYAGTIFKSVFPENKITLWHDSLNEEEQNALAQKTAYGITGTVVGLGLLVAAHYARK